MVSETAFEEKLLVIEQWVKTHDGLPEKIGETFKNKKQYWFI